MREKATQTGCHSINTKISLRAEKQNFFAQKLHSGPADLQASNKNGDDDLDDDKLGPDATVTTNAEKLTTSYLTFAFDALSQKFITSWQHSMDSLHEDVQELGQRTSQTE
ncbi:Hypothetical predicted protein [Pelobates cultripes]|uniref:Uncharacterized protein n=1 Tax=Pelobates cultripes TaxID=61616 RepID=A0AAD1W203_PELCU|nr:Hypothetical predicted protein [Pelobates cultripes]